MKSYDDSHCKSDPFFSCPVSVIMVSKTSRATIQYQAIQSHNYIRLEGSSDHTTLPWLAIRSHEDSDTQEWWRTTGVPLEILLQKAGYTMQSQYRHLTFYREHIIPYLGAPLHAPNESSYWKSFMTDSHTPIEMSWDWGCGDRKPVIRYSVELIGRGAGTEKDPYNEEALNQFIKGYRRMFPDTNLLWYNHFLEKLAVYSSTRTTANGNEKLDTHESRIFLAFDLGEDGAMLKAYFFPLFKAAMTGKSKMAVLSDAIINLPDHPPFPALAVLQSYIRTSDAGRKLEVEILGIDCDAPAKSRLKVYVRSPETSFSAVRETMTLGGLLEKPGSEQGFKELAKIWKLILGNGEVFHELDDLDHVEHRTAGMLYYFEMRSGQMLPESKVYLPVRHYGRSDLATALGLQTYLESRGQGSLASQYVEALRSIRYVVTDVHMFTIFDSFSHSRESLLANQRGFQSYLGCSIINDVLKVTSYIDPMAKGCANCVTVEQDCEHGSITR